MPVQAQGLSYTKFHSDIAIHNDASIRVTETIEVNFSSAHHGIFRNIPYRFATQNGGQASIPIDISGVSQDGRDTQYSTTTDGTYVKVKIGDANNTISGSHEYVIRYTAQAATNFFADHDELYWNVTGDQWDEPLSNVSATVRLPSIFPVSSISATCYTGKTGSTQHNCTDDRADSTVSFTSTDYLTIVVGWPTGFVTKPANFDQLRTAGSASTPVTRANSYSGWRLLVNIFLPLLMFIFMFHRWWKHGRDPVGKKTIVAEYDPPAGLRPAELGVVRTQQVSSVAISATIIDLAVRGYLKIVEINKPFALGIGHYRDYALQSLRPADASCCDYEQALLQALFQNPSVPSENGQVRLAAFKNHRESAAIFESIRSTIMEGVTARGYYVQNPNKVRLVYVPIGLAIAVSGYFLLDAGLSLSGVLVSGLILAGFGWVLPQRTAEGVEIVRQASGFKLFLEKAEKYRLQWQEREGIFEKFLPYAMVLGVAQKWSTALSSLSSQPPSWYEGNMQGNFNTLILWSALSNFSSSVGESSVSGAASGSSGFSGGSSGGGGGGGGGGGW